MKIFFAHQNMTFIEWKYFYQVLLLFSNHMGEGEGAACIPRFPSDKNISGLLLYSWLINVVSMKLERSIVK